MSDENSLRCYYCDFPIKLDGIDKCPCENILMEDFLKELEIENYWKNQTEF
jgi:hypothetical protein